MVSGGPKGHAYFVTGMNTCFIVGVSSQTGPNTKVWEVIPGSMGRKNVQ